MIVALKSIRRLALVIMLFGFPTALVSAQQRSASLDDPSVIYRPRSVRDGESYPLVVFLPYTGGTARDQARAFGVTPGRQSDFFVMLPPGRFSRGDYLPDFTRFVGWVEERVISDVRSVINDYPIDPDSVYLAGYSLGGDLSWALMVRNPVEVAGTVMAGTRASYPLSADGLSVIRRRQHRLAMLIGNRESPARYEGINRARSAIEGAGLEVFYREYNGGHSIPPRRLLGEALAWVLADSALPVADRPVTTEPLDRPLSGPREDGPPVVQGQPEASTVELDMDWSFLYTRPSGFATLGYMPPSVFSQSGDNLSGLHEAHLSYEAFLGGVWISGATEYYSARTTTGLRVAHVPQRLTVGAYSSPSWGVGADWSWYSFFESSPETTAARRFALHATIAHGGGPLPLDGQLTARIRAPLSVGSLALLDVANGELEYAVEIADAVIIDLGVASYAEQNAPASTLVGLAESLDHVVRWRTGVAVRYPTRLTWGLVYTGEARRDLQQTGGEQTRHLFQLQLGVLF